MSEEVLIKSMWTGLPPGIDSAFESSGYAAVWCAGLLEVEMRVDSNPRNRYGR